MKMHVVFCDPYLPLHEGIKVEFYGVFQRNMLFVVVYKGSNNFEKRGACCNKPI